MGDTSDSFFRRAEPTLHAAVGDPAGKRILDLGCGHGWLGARYAAAGATVVGVDGSQALIRKARATAAEATWLVYDLGAGIPANAGTFDVAIAHMVLMDVPALEPLLTDLRNVLRQQGRFVATILYPAGSSRPKRTPSTTTCSTSRSRVPRIRP